MWLCKHRYHREILPIANTIITVIFKCYMAIFSKEYIKGIQEKSKQFTIEQISKAIEEYKQENSPRGDILIYRLEILTSILDSINSKFHQDLASSDLEIFKRNLVKIIEHSLPKLLVLAGLPEQNPNKSDKLIESIYFRRSDYVFDTKAIMEIKNEAIATINDLKIILGRYLQLNNIDKIKYSELKIIRTKTEEIIKTIELQRQKEFQKMGLLAQVAFFSQYNFFEDENKGNVSKIEFQKKPINNETRTFNGRILPDHWIMMEHLDVQNNPEYIKKLEQIKIILDRDGIEALELLPYMRQIIKQRRSDFDNGKISKRELLETLKVVLRDLKLRIKHQFESEIESNFINNEVLGYYTDKNNQIVLLVWSDIVDTDLNLTHENTNVKSFIITPIHMSETQIQSDSIYYSLLKIKKLRGYSIRKK